MIHINDSIPMLVVILLAFATWLTALQVMEFFKEILVDLLAVSDEVYQLHPEHNLW